MLLPPVSAIIALAYYSQGALERSEPDVKRSVQTAAGAGARAAAAAEAVAERSAAAHDDGGSW